MSHPFYLDTECVGEGDSDCPNNVQHELKIETKADKARFTMDSILSLKDAVKELKKLEVYEAASKVEEKIQQHHNLNIGPDKRLYCDDCYEEIAE